MDQFRKEGFVTSDDLRLESLGGGLMVIEGTVRCVGPINLSVYKTLETVKGRGADALVQCVAYSYNAALEGLGNILRYESPHKTHNQDHHVHRFDVLGSEAETLKWIRDDEWPTLGEVIEELRDWYYENEARIRTALLR